jgi:hypothetical protein
VTDSSNTKGFRKVDAETLRKFGTDAGQSKKANGADPDGGWEDPYMGVLELRRRRPPSFPTGLFGPDWGRWLGDTAQAAACPVDYVAMPLLASSSALIGNARWAQASPGWTEPPHVWCGNVGDSGDGKTPGSNCLLLYVLPEIERRIVGDYEDRLRDWELAVEADRIAKANWQKELRKDPHAPRPPQLAEPMMPMKPRLRQYDVTVEQVAMVLAHAAPKGALIVRDELAGWLIGMDLYNASGRQFWIEAYNGGFFRVERRKHEAAPIDVERSVVAVYGSIQPARLADLFNAPDDGLFARFQWAWPDPLPFRLGTVAPDTEWAIEALDRLRVLELHSNGERLYPIIVPLAGDALDYLDAFAHEMEDRKAEAGGLMKSAYAKARGTALRLSLVLEYLWWSGRDGFDAPPTVVSADAFVAASAMVAEYLMPMAERVYGDAASTGDEKGAATLAQWIRKTQPDEVHVRTLQRDVRLPGMRNSAQIKKAADILVEAD